MSLHEPCVAESGHGLAVIVGVVALTALSLGAHCATESIASGRAEQARKALPVGANCPELIAVAERYANEASIGDARAACAAGTAAVVTLNFSQAMSLNYLVKVGISREGRVLTVSDVGAW